jgi:hypothetical protein
MCAAMSRSSIKRPPDQQVSNGGRASGGGHKTPKVRSKNCFLSRTDRGRLSSAHVAVTAADDLHVLFVTTVGSMK